MAKEKQENDFSFTVRVITGDDLDDSFSTGTFLNPTHLTNWDPAFGGDRDCKLFLFDFPDGLRGLLGEGYNGEPVRFVAAWYGPCGSLAANARNAECTLDEDQVVAVLQGELTVNAEG